MFSSRTLHFQNQKGMAVNITMNNEIEHMQVRLFQKAWRKWKIDMNGPDYISDEYDLELERRT